MFKHPHPPTPVRQLQAPQIGPGTLWLKDDGVLGTRYGGNKVRKLALLLEHARERGIREILTIGAAGSHHVLATTLCAAEYGIEVSALMVPQHHTPHAERTLRCSFGHGARLLPMGSLGGLGTALGLLVQRDVMWLGPGAMGVLGSTSYVLAVNELQAQLEAGLLPEPDQIVVAVGSGSTAAGLLVGLEQVGLRARLVAVPAGNGALTRASVLGQAWRLARHLKLDTKLSKLDARLHFDLSATGPGYGVPSREGSSALELGTTLGVTLEPTYTAKAFAVALKCPARDGTTTLYWHTLSSHAPAPLLEGARSSTNLPPALRALLR